MATTSAALLWNLVRVIGQSGLGLIVSMVLARLLAPEDFGLMALAGVFIAFSEMVASVGMTSAIVQNPKLDEKRINVGQTLAFSLGTFLLVTFWLLAEPTGELFDNERLAPLVPWLAVAVWFSIAGSVSRGLLMREMNFKQLMVIDFFAYGIGYALVAVSMAVMGYGIWSLIIGTLCASVITSIWLFIAAPFHFKPSFSKEEVKEIFVFSAGVGLINIAGFLSMKVSDVMIGKYLGERNLGLYSRAAHTADIPFMKIALTISSVMFSAYSSIQDDLERLNEQYLKAIRLVSATSIPVLAGLAINAEYVILGMYGDQWGDAVILFQIACVGGVFNNVLHLGGAVVQATNNVYKEVWLQYASFVFLFVGLWIAAELEWGLEAMVWVCTATSVFLYLLMANLVHRILGSSWIDYFAAQLPGIILSIPVIAADYYAILYLKTFPELHPAIGLLILVAVSGVVYVAAVIGLPDSWIGGIRGWIAERYGHKLPSYALRFFRS